VLRWEGRGAHCGGREPESLCAVLEAPRAVLGGTGSG
jgi:hypothetical protein